MGYIIKHKSTQLPSKELQQQKTSDDPKDIVEGKIRPIDKETVTEAPAKNLEPDSELANPSIGESSTTRKENITLNLKNPKFWLRICIIFAIVVTVISVVNNAGAKNM